MPDPDADLQLPPGLQPGPSPQPTPVEQPIDEMGIVNPTHDISRYIKYRYYKCQNPKCGKKEFAAPGDKEEYVQCSCSPSGAVPDPKTKLMPHNRMKLLVYAARRDGQPMTADDFEQAALQK